MARKKFDSEGEETAEIKIENKPAWIFYIKTKS